jgi:tetraacyldisaccharide 4'-kinase
MLRPAGRSLARLLMGTEDWYREVVSGTSRGLVASLARTAFACAEPIYGAVVARKNRAFDSGRRQPAQVAAPVISVGNLTVGGTGKTPLVAWLAEWFRAQGVAVSLISRGYGAKRGRPNDEALELAAKLPGVPHLQNPDRVAAACEALVANPRQVLILDDAFQHRRIARDLDIVLLDALAPFGYERLLPRGLLREPAASLARADVVALSRADAIDAASRLAIAERVRKLAPQALWIEMSHRAAHLVNVRGERALLANFVGQSVAAFCGIGNPAGFRHTLESSGFAVAAFRPLADHCAYSAAELTALEAWAAAASASAVICTKKDLVKLSETHLGGHPLWALEIELAIDAGHDAFVQRLTAIRHQLA